VYEEHRDVLGMVVKKKNVESEVRAVWLQL